MVRKKASAPVQPVQVGIAVESGDGTPHFYINYAEISHTKNDFCLTGARIPARFGRTKLEEIRAAGALVVDAEVQLIFPPTVIPGLIRALTAQREQYEKQLNMVIKDTGLDND